jgi:LDH2 family malate/lactate/ureidoglycolate dehydrogenase
MTQHDSHPVSPRFRAERLGRLTQGILQARGMSLNEARIVAEALTWADLRGMDTHGVSRIPMYMRLINKSEMDPKAQLELIHDTLAVKVIEAHRSAGPLAMGWASELAIDMAKKAGIGMVMVRNTTHTAALGIFTEKVAQAGMSCIAMAASRPNMAYHGAKAAGVSTAPFSLSVPGPNNTPIILDMASGVVSMGKLVQYKAKHQQLEPGWALDERGEETIDPQAAAIPKPLGGPKGSGLSLMIELMTGLPLMNPLIGHFFSGEFEAKRHCQNAMIIAMDIYQFCAKEDFEKEIAQCIQTLKALPVDEKVGEILMPGERGYRERARREKEGIALPTSLLQTLNELAVSLGVEPLSVDS